MKFLIATADIVEIREPGTHRLVDGATANPARMSKADTKPNDVRLRVRQAPRRPREGTEVTHGSNVSKSHGWQSRGCVAALVALTALVTGCTDGDGPVIQTVTPTSAVRNGTVTLTGERFCGPSADCTDAGGEVQIGTGSTIVRGIVVNYTDTMASVVVPPATPVGSTELVLTVDGRSSNSITITVLQ